MSKEGRKRLPCWTDRTPPLTQILDDLEEERMNRETAEGLETKVYVDGSHLEVGTSTSVPAVKLDIARMLGDLTREREVAQSFTALFAPRTFRLLDMLDRVPESEKHIGAIFGFPVVVSRAVPEGEMRTMEGGTLVDLRSVKVERRIVLVDTHYNDAPDPEGVRIACTHVGGSEAKWGDARTTRERGNVTCINCYLLLKMQPEERATGEDGETPGGHQ